MFKSKPLLFISLFIIISDIFFIGINYYSTLNSLKSDTRQWAKDQQHVFNLLLEEKATSMQQIATYVASDINVQQLFLFGKEMLASKGGDSSAPAVQYMRTKLYNSVKSSWTEMASRYDVRQLHFHLGPGSNSYLRVHRPEKYGDNMDEVRYTIVDANKNLKPTKGFETGRVYSGIRGVVPVYAANINNEKVHVGALEAGTSFSDTLSILGEELESNITILLTQDHVGKNMWPDFITRTFTDKQTIEGYYIECSTLQDVKTVLAQAPILKAIRNNLEADIIHADGIWQLCSFPLRDYRGSLDPSLPDAGTVVVLRGASDKWGEVQQSLIINITFSIVALVLVELALFMGWHISKNHLNAIISRQTSELQKLANYDGLTSLLNRRAIEDILQREMSRFNRYNTFLTVMLFDLDHFKKVNDTYGHNVGDEVLKKTAELINNVIRKNDYAGRWGGEEFLIIAPDTPLESGVQLAERIRNEMATYEFVEVGSVTLSIGVSRCERGEKLDQLIKRTDDALYLAKKKGRNSVEVAV